MNNSNVVKILDEHNGKIKKAGMKAKVTLFVDIKTGERHVGGSIELFETKSDTPILSGINIDIGATDSFDIFAGISKDIYIAGQEFSIGGYVDITDIGKQLYRRIFKGDREGMGVKVKVGISKVF